jgi:hypothetical protein
MQIIFNGKTYNNVDEMPANERQAYESMFQIFTDANGNGIPDFLEGDIAKNVMTAFTNVVHYDGKIYNSMDDLPPEARQKVQDAFAKLNQLGIITAAPSAQKTSAFEPAFQPSRPLISQEPTIQEGGGRNWLIIVGFLGAVLICAVAIAVAIFFLR